MHYKYVVTLDPNEGSVTPTTIDVPQGNAIGELPAPTHDTLFFDGWYDALTDGNRIDREYVPTGNMTIYARWAPVDSFPTVFEHAGACTFNGAGVNMTGAECSEYANDEFINTNISLFSQENIGLDFEITFDVSNVDLTNISNINREALIANKNELGEGIFAYGFALRLDSKFIYYYTNDGVSTIKHEIGTNLTSVRLIRLNDKMYFSFNGEPLKYLADADLDHPFTSPLTFGAALDENQQPFRHIKATISNVKVRLGKYHE